MRPWSSITSSVPLALPSVTSCLRLFEKSCQLIGYQVQNIHAFLPCCFLALTRLLRSRMSQAAGLCGEYLGMWECFLTAYFLLRIWWLPFPTCCTVPEEACILAPPFITFVLETLPKVLPWIKECGFWGTCFIISISTCLWKPEWNPVRTGFYLGKLQRVSIPDRHWCLNGNQSVFWTCVQS